MVNLLSVIREFNPNSNLFDDFARLKIGTENSSEENLLRVRKSSEVIWF